MREGWCVCVRAVMCCRGSASLFSWGKPHFDLLHRSADMTSRPKSFGKNQA